MEIDPPVEDGKGDIDSNSKEGKRTKWQLPPSHHNLFASPDVMPMRSKFSNHKQQQLNVSRNDLPSALNIPEGREHQKNSFANADDNMSLREIENALTDPKLSRVSMMARAEICPKIHRARLMGTKGIAAKISEQYGYEISNTTFLYAEEALYLLEIGKLEIFHGRVSLSVERARSLLLNSKSHPFPELNPSRIKTCSVDEYLVYKHLSELGYRVRRRDIHNDVKFNTVQQSCYSRLSENTTPLPVNETEDTEMTVCDVNDERCAMDLDEESIHTKSQLLNPFPPMNSSSFGVGISHAESLIPKGTKRKFGELSSDLTAGSTTSSAKDMSDDDNADADEELEFVPNSVPGSSHMDAAESMFGQPTSFNYTVIEADSDVEIIEQPDLFEGASCTNGVLIEEIGYGYDGDVDEDSGIAPEPQPSTSAACFATHSQAVVDLADSDSETSESLSSFHKLWNKFVPNSTIQIGFPPSVLLPNNIPSRVTIYEFEIKSGDSLRSDSDLEYYVDELTLSPSPGESENKKQGCFHKTWKEWRQRTMTEVEGVLNESLLGPQILYAQSTEDPMKKLHLWGQKEPELKRKADGGWRNFNIPYELYHPSVGFVKCKTRKDIVPNYVVAVVRNDEIVPSFASCDPLINGVPALIALVSDESSIMFMNPDSSPIPSLF